MHVIIDDQLKMNSLVTGAPDKSGLSRTQLQLNQSFDQKGHIGHRQTSRSRQGQLSFFPGKKGEIYLYQISVQNMRPKAKVEAHKKHSLAATVA